jgi:hypothetical protein
MKRLIESGKSDPLAYKGNTDWLSPRSQEDSIVFLREVSSIYSSKGEYSLHLDNLVQAGRFREVVEFDIPSQGVELEDFRGATQIRALFSKNTWVDLGYNPLLEGVKSFLKAEQRCRDTNLSFSLSRPDIGRVGKVFNLAREKLADVIGRCPSLQQLQLRYGPGANTQVKMAQATLSGKLLAKLACSEDMLPFVGEFLAELPQLSTVWHQMWADQVTREVGKPCFPLYEPDPEFVRVTVSVEVDDGKLVFVPKNAKTHRPIIIEPPLNGMFQLGVGTYLKDRLALEGLDLRDQERNRKLAREGSIDGSLATIDLSIASDTLAWELVAYMLPLEWLDLLGKLRTGTFAYEGTSYQLEKFSSMGNGFTFELESAIFYALTFGCVSFLGGDVSKIGVFGDDIIVPTDAVELLFEVFDRAGFWVNPQKSFWSGSFRESCGADWLDGNDVRPFFVRDVISDKTLYNFHNWALRRGERELAILCRDWTWEHNHLFGPDGYGDGHLLGSHSLHTRRKDRRAGWCGGYFDTYSLKPLRQRNRGAADWLIPTYSVYVRSGAETPTDPYSLRGSDGYVRTSVYTLTQGIFLR